MVLNSLKRTRCSIVADVLALSDDDLRDIRHFGSGSILRLREALNPGNVPAVTPCTANCDATAQPGGVLCDWHFERVLAGRSDMLARKPGEIPQRKRAAFSNTGRWMLDDTPRTAKAELYELSPDTVRKLRCIDDLADRLVAANEIAVATNPRTVKMSRLRSIRAYAIRVLYHDYNWRQARIRLWMGEKDTHIVNDAIRVGKELAYSERPPVEVLPIPNREDESWAQGVLLQTHREFVELENAGRSARAIRQDLIRALAGSGWTTKELSELTGLTTGGVSQIKRGTANPNGNTGSAAYDRAHSLVRAVLGSSLRSDVIYPEPLDPALWRWYGATEVHNIVIAVACLYRPRSGFPQGRGHFRQGPWEFLVPAPVRSVLQAGWTVQHGYIVCDLPFDPDLGLLTDPADEEFVTPLSAAG